MPVSASETRLPLRRRGDCHLLVYQGTRLYELYGADGGSLYVSATVDVVIATSSLRSIKATDFEMVDGGSRYTWSDHKCQRTPVTN